MHHIKNSFLLAISFISLKAQNLDSLMANIQPKNEIEYVSYTFKGTKLINGHSIENTKKGALQLMFQHRFTPIGTGPVSFFGLDGATIRIAFDYGVTNWLNVGIGRSTLQKALDGFVKIKIARQSNKMPISIGVLGTTALNTQSIANSSKFAHKLYYTTQLIIARKFSENFSAQIMPTLVHRNFVTDNNASNTIISLGAGLRYKFSKRMAIVGEYYFTPQSRLENGYFGNIVALGLDIETGGHVFQLHFTNSQGMIEHQMIGMTNNYIKNAFNSLRLGFNLNRNFTLIKNKEASW